MYVLSQKVGNSVILRDGTVESLFLNEGLVIITRGRPFHILLTIGNASVYGLGESGASSDTSLKSLLRGGTRGL